MDIQRIRNITTGTLHTEMTHIYEDFEYLTGDIWFTHQLPNVRRAMIPWLKTKITDPKFWEEKFDTEHTGDVELEPMNKQEYTEFCIQYAGANKY